MKKLTNVTNIKGIASTFTEIAKVLAGNFEKFKSDLLEHTMKIAPVTVFAEEEEKSTGVEETNEQEGTNEEQKVEEEKLETEEAKEEEPKKEEPKEEKAQPKKDTSKETFSDVIERIRKEEKDKLYANQEKLRKEIETEKEAKRKAVEIAKEKETTIKELTEENAKLKEQLEKGINESDLYIENVTLKEKIEKMEKSHKKTLHKIELDTFKQRELEKYGDQIIPELVEGNTKEELEKSMKASHDRFLEIAGPTQEEDTTEIPDIDTGVDISNKLSLHETTKDIGSMTMEEYKEYRKQLGLK